MQDLNFSNKKVGADEKMFEFGFLSFEIKDEQITINGFPFSDIQIAGENKNSHFGSKMIKSSEGARLKYLSHKIADGKLTVYQQNERISVKTVFSGFDDTNALQIYTEVKNVSEKPITLEEVSAFLLTGIAGGIEDTKNAYLYKFTQSHHAECQPRKFSLFDLGIFKANPTSQKRVSGINIGSWSTKEEIPQGIIEYNNNFLMFQIESNNSWYYEISDNAGQLYLYLGGANCQFGGFYKTLAPNESYTTNKVALCAGNSLNSVLGEMTKYRRKIAGRCEADEELPTIFNEYMHLSWDSPTAEQTAKIAPAVAQTGVKYYVIDCGWHNEEDGNIIYPYVGQWKESKARFPHGLRKTTDFIRSLGMKAGLWIEPEIIGYKCQDMLDYYDDDCFITRHGEKVFVMNRYFLDYRNKKVYDYMSETIRRMVEDYGADYIKMDYNQDLGIGTDKDSDSFGDGLQQCAKAYLSWVDDMRKRFPETLFETCSSGGMRMDYETLKHFSIISTSDQTDYTKYPYIAGNILSAVLPEQAAVWSYPVDSYGVPGSEFVPTTEWVELHITGEQVVMNMINSFVGRMHLASHIELLPKKYLTIVQEGIKYFDSISEIKKKALPYLPLGFTDFSKDTVISGLKYGTKIYLAVWNLGGNKCKSVELDKNIRNAKIVYPYNNGKVKFKGKRLEVELPCEYSARFVEIETE